MVDPEKEVAIRDQIDTRSQGASASRLFMGLVILGANLLFGLRGLDIGSRVLIDTDGYMRYNRVIELVAGLNGWWDGWAHRANAPFGHSMHWTRPLDALLIALAAPVAAVSSWSEGVYFAALVVGPLLHLALGVAVAWTARPLVGVTGSYLAGMGVAAQSGILSYAAPGRPDHHILIVVFAVLLIGSAIRLSLDGRRRWVTVGGLSGAAGLWISTEFLAPLAIVLVFLGWRAVVGTNYLASFGLRFGMGVVGAARSRATSKRILSNRVRPPLDRASGAGRANQPGWSGRKRVNRHQEIAQPWHWWFGRCGCDVRALSTLLRRPVRRGSAERRRYLARSCRRACTVMGRRPSPPQRPVAARWDRGNWSHYRHGSPSPTQAEQRVGFSADRAGDFSRPQCSQHPLRGLPGGAGLDTDRGLGSRTAWLLDRAEAFSNRCGASW